MLDLLYKYLILHKSVGIPGIGSFKINNGPAVLDGHELQPPVRQVCFSAGTALTDKNFYHFVAREKGISEVDAVRQFQDFAYNLKKSIQSNPSIEISGMGVFKRNQSGEIVFSPAEQHRYFPLLKPLEVKSAPAESHPAPVVEHQDDITGTNDNEEQVVAKERWWIWATVLALLALAAIGYFYFAEEM